jgi:hypothetical protein
VYMAAFEKLRVSIFTESTRYSARPGLTGARASLVPSSTWPNPTRLPHIRAAFERDGKDCAPFECGAPILDENDDETLTTAQRGTAVATNRCYLSRR